MESIDLRFFFSLLAILISIIVILVIIIPIIKSVRPNTVRKKGKKIIITINKRDSDGWTIISKYCSPIDEDKLLFRVYLSDINISSGLIYIDPYRAINKNKAIVILVKKEDIKRVEEEKVMGDLFIKVVLKSRGSIIESDTLKQWRGYYEEK